MLSTWLPTPPAKRAGRKARRAPREVLNVERLEARDVPTSGLFLQGTAFVDGNANGVLDPGESYLAGAVVSLYDQGGTIIASVTTGADGRYLFNASNTGGKLVPGTYQLIEQAPGFDNTGASALSQINPVNVLSANTIEVTLVDPTGLRINFDTDDLFNNASLFQVETYTINGTSYTNSVGQLPVSLSGGGLAGPVSFLTLCNNLFQDIEAGINQFGVTPQTTNSATSTPLSVHNEGRIGYLFNRYGTSALGSTSQAAALQLAVWELQYDANPNLASGNFVYTGPLAAQVQALINESAGKNEAVTFLDARTKLVGGWQGMMAAGSYNFGNTPKTSPPAELHGCVYVDANNDGIRQANEAPIAGVTIVLTGFDDTGAAINLTTTTNASGDFSFTNLRAGTYTVTEFQPAGFLDGKDSAGNFGGTVGNDVISGIELPAGAKATGYCFGELPKSDDACLSGYVYVDANCNGLRDAGEAGIAGVTVTLTGRTNSGQNVSLVTTTDANGFYQFTGLQAGTYVLTETQPAGYLDGQESLGTAGGRVSNDKFTDIRLRSGFCATDYNFGEKLENNMLKGGYTATIGFWQNKNGQALIRSFNGGANSTALGNWLATNFPRLWGNQSGGNNLAGKSNDFVADYFITLFKVKGQKVYAQALANALAIYSTTSSLGGNAGVRYGFTVTSTGLGTLMYNIGSSGAAFGVPNNTLMSVYDILKAANNFAVNGVLYGGNQSLINMANEVFDGINQKGHI